VFNPKPRPPRPGVFLVQYCHPFCTDLILACAVENRHRSLELRDKHPTVSRLSLPGRGTLDNTVADLLLGVVGPQLGLLNLLETNVPHGVVIGPASDHGDVRDSL